MDLGTESLIFDCSLEGHLGFRVHELQLSGGMVTSSHRKIHCFLMDLLSFFFLSKTPQFLRHVKEEVEGRRELFPNQPNLSLSFLVILSFPLNPAVYIAPISVPGEKEKMGLAPNLR